MKRIKRKMGKMCNLSFYENVLISMLRPFVLVVFHPGYAFGKSVAAAKSLLGGFKKIARWSWKTWPRRLVSLALVSFIILAPLSGLLWQQKTEAAWWNDLWGYRKAITVTNSSGGALSDFQVSFTLDTTDTTKFNNSCADIRVTNYNGDVLPHWIEENNPGCGNAATKIWTKISTLGTGDSTIYVYYGNPMAVNIASGKNVFEFFDDFSDNSFTNTNWTVGAGSWTLENGQYKGIGNSNTDAYAMANYTSANDYIVEARGKTGSTHVGLSVRSSTGSQYYEGEVHATTSIYMYRFTNPNTYNSLGSTAGSFSANSWYNLKFSASGNSLRWEVMDNTQTNKVINSTDSNFPSGKPGVWTYSDTSYFDNFRIRKYVSTEPTTSTSATEEKSTAPVGYWSFDEGYGTVARDESPNRNNGAVTNAVWKPESECLSGKCLYFDGSGDVVTITDPSNGSLDFGTSSFSVSFWIRTKQNTSVSVLTKVQSSKGYSVNVLDGTGGKTFGRIHDGINESYRYGSDNYDFYNNEWQHYYAVFDRAQSYPDIYINGKLMNGSGGGGIQPNVGDISNAANLSLGSSFQGFLDEIKIYSYVRSSDQIKQDYNAGMAGMGKAKDGAALSVGGSSDKWLTDGLVGYWKLDESSGTSVADASGNANTGTLTNAQETGTSDASGNSTTTLIDTDGASLSTTDDVYNGMILRNTSACGSISSGTEKVITDYVGATKTFTVGVAWANAPDSCPYEIRHQVGGKFGNGIIGDGVNDHVSVDNSTGRFNFSSTQSYTYSIWTKFSSLSSNGGLINNNWNIYSYWTNNFNDFQFSIYDGITAVRTRPDTTKISTGSWYHFVFVVDRQNNKTYLYQNGTQVDSEDISGLGSSAGQSAVYFGRSGSNYFPGVIDETRIYSRALSSEEAAKLYEWAPGPMHHYRFEEGTGTTVYDEGIGAPEGQQTGTVYGGVAGSADSGTTETMVKETAPAYWLNYSNDYYNGWKIKATSGSASGQIATITDYRVISTQNDKEIDFTPALTGFASGDSYQIYYDDTTGPEWKSGKNGKGIYFDGYDDYIQLGTFSSFYPASLRRDSLTISAWIKTENTSGDHYIYRKNGPLTILTSGSTLIGRITDLGGTGRSATTASGSIVAGQWQYISITFDGLVIRVYINGILSASQDCTGISITQNGQDVLGANNNGSPEGNPSNYFKGYIDDFRFYNYARNQKQIMADMSASAPASSGQGGLADPLAYYKFDEGIASTTYNSGVGGTALNGTLNSGGSGTNDTVTKMWDNGGKYGKAIEFDGTNDNVSIADVDNATDFDYNQNFSVSTWVKIPSTQLNTAYTSNSIIEKWASVGGYPYVLRVYNQTYGTVADRGKIFFARYDGTNNPSLKSTTTLNDNVFHHLVYAKNGSNLSLYIDGKLNNTATDTITTTTLNSSPLYIGSRGGSFYFTGLVDDLKIYSYALTAEDVESDYNQNKAMILGSSGSVSGTGSSTNAASGEYCVPGDTTACAAPVGEWKLDEKVSGDAQTLYDTSGNGNNGTSNDGANNTGMNCTKPGKFGSSCEFDGVDDYMEVPDNDMFDFGTGDFTVSMWIKIPFSSTPPDLIYPGIFGKGINSSAVAHTWGFLQQRLSNRVIYWRQAVDAGGSWGAAFQTPSLSDGWHYIAITRSGTTENMYIDGNYFTQDTTAGDNITNTAPILFAKAYNIGEYSGSNLDQVRIYNYARTPAQIAWEYNQGKPVAHWKFEEGSGTTVHDESGNGYNGTMYNMNSTTDWVTGKFGGALNFNGDDITKINAGMPNNMSSYSVCAWVNPDSLVNADNDTEIYLLMRKFLLFFNNSGQLTFRIKTSSVYPEVLSSKNLTTGQWQHVCGVFSGMGYGLQLYLNGENVSTSSRTGNGTLDDDSAITPVIGSATNDYWGNLDGKMDDVRIYNYALTAEQVKQVMNEGYAIKL